MAEDAVLTLGRRHIRDARTVTAALVHDLIADATADPEGPTARAVRTCAPIWQSLGEQGAPIRPHHGRLSEDDAAVLAAIAGGVCSRWNDFAEDARQAISGDEHPEVAAYAAERAAFLQSVADSASRLRDVLAPYATA
jgi:hypothetical protein